MKKGFYSIGSIIILLLAAVIFVLVPAMSERSSGKQLPDYGSFNGRHIRYEEGSEFHKAVNELKDYYEAQGADFENEYAAMFYSQIFSQAFQNVIGSYALDYFTESTGYVVPTSALNRAIRKLDIYCDSNGQFSAAMYENYTDTEKRKTQESVVKNLTQMRSYEDLFGSMAEVGYAPIYGLKCSSGEIEFIRKMGEKKHAFDAVSFDMKNYPDSEKVAFGKAHTDLFVNYNLKVISCESEAKAKEVVKRINNSEITFEDAFTEYSKAYYGDPETGVLSASHKYQLETAVVKPEDLDSIISLSAGAISPVIETASGYCVFKATEVPSQPDFDDPQTIATVYSYLLTREKSVIEDYYANIAKDFASKAQRSSFEEAVAEFNVPVTNIDPMALNFNDTSLVGSTPIAPDSTLGSVTSNENFFKTAFKLKKNEISAPVVLSASNQVIVLKCTDIAMGGTSIEDSKTVIAPAIAQASKASINYSILQNDKIVNNATEFMAVFNNNKS